jgi:transcriptional regulator with XRE-family HTH domain
VRVETPGTGTDAVDLLIDGVRIGDNLVFQADTDRPLDLLVARFVSGARGRVPLVRVRLDPVEPAEEPGVHHVDWSPVVTGRASSSATALAPDAGVAEALRSLEEADERVGGGAAFVLPPLGEVSAVWGSAAALEVFLSTCPRLFSRRSLALWPVRRDQHRPAFLRRLEEITQVVVDISVDEELLRLVVRKADGRDASVIGRATDARIVGGDLEAVGAPTTTRERLGHVIRDRRIAQGLSQAELARRIGITPSALSQVERGVRGPSGDTLMRLWEALEVPFGPPTTPERGYRVARRGARERTRLQEGLTGERIVDDPRVGQQWWLRVDPGASGTRGPFTVKATESVLLVSGVLDLQLGGHTETLQAGDALVASTAIVTGWANPSRMPAEALWSLHPAS